MSDPNTTPPQSLDAEQHVLGSMMLGKTAALDAIGALQSSDFYREAHRALFNVISYLVTNDYPIALNTVLEEARHRGQLELVGGLPYLASLLHVVSSPANILYDAQTVKGASVLRSVLQICEDTVKETQGKRLRDAHEVVASMEQKISSIAGTGRNGFRKVGDISHEVVENLKKAARGDGDLPGCSSGYEHLDKITMGLRRAELIIVAARPSMGKTALAMSMAASVAREVTEKGEDTPIIIFSREMSSQLLLGRMLSQEAHVPASKVMHPTTLTEWDLAALTTADEHLQELPILIDDSSDTTISEMRGSCRRVLQSKKGIALVIVDYIQLFSKSENTKYDVDQIVRGLKEMAKELDCPVVALSQVSRSLEKREDKRPMLSDLSESGGIEATADTVIFLYRPNFYIKDRPKVVTDNAEIIVAKQRNGPVGSITLLFVPEFAEFRGMPDAWSGEADDLY